jgi:NADP-dependent 3-hydroxy acid dehydrogenase YdfG
LFWQTLFIHAGRMTMFNVENKVVIITGASSGIGEAIARMLAKNGARVVLGARRIDRLKLITKDIRADGGIAEYQALDVTQRSQVEDIVKFAQTKFDRLFAISRKQMGEWTENRSLWRSISVI